jgi:hypothetical protein
MGVEPGDRIVLLIPVGIDLYIGATATLLDPAADIQNILTRYPVDGLMGVPKRTRSG